MTTMRSVLDNSAKLTATCVLAAPVLVTVIGGCSTGSDREAYFESRESVIAAQPGTGTSRVAMWPSNAWGKTALAKADRRTATDAVMPTR